MISSVSNITQTYATSKVSNTTAISAYNDVSSAKPLSHMEQMQEKYKDVYVPMPTSYSKENEASKNKLLAEKYPDFQEETKKMYIDMEPTASGHKLLKEGVFMYGSKEAQQEFFDYRDGIGAIYPQNMYEHPGFPTSNAKELATFYNGAVYEGLESGKDLKTAKRDASNATSSFVDQSSYIDHFTKMIYSNMDNIKLDFSEENTLQYQNKERFDIDLTNYGFSFDSVPKNQYDETSMVNYISNKIKEYEFTLTNPSIVESEFQKLNSSYIRDRNSYDTIIKPIEEYKLPNARLALDVYSKYKIFDSVDIKA